MFTQNAKSTTWKYQCVLVSMLQSHVVCSHCVFHLAKSWSDCALFAL